MSCAFAWCMLVNVCAGSQGQTPDNSDPYLKTNYKIAFDVKILEEFSDVLEQDGAIANMPSSFVRKSSFALGAQRTSPSASRQLGDYQPLSVSSSDVDMLEGRTFSQENDGAYQTRKTAMIAAIMQKLKRCKRDAVLRPMYEAGIAVAVEGACMFTLIECLGTDNFGASFGIFAFAGTVGYAIKPAAKAIYSHFYPGHDLYESWEEQFAEKMPYIPNRLWRQIRDNFAAARKGELDYQKATDYFDIAFNLPIIHRFPYVAPLSEVSLSKRADEINQFTNSFFEDYKDSLAADLSLSGVVREYLKKLTYDENGFVCVHLKGRGGIGKTHYIKALSHKISEVLGQDIPVEKIDIRSDDSSELEGSKESPGKVLTGVSRISKLGKPYGILVFDEAAWLNGTLKEAAKNMFEPNNGCFNSLYLDKMEFSLKGFLVAFMSNDEINDKALKDRMINIDFPNLKKESLRRMALEDLESYLEGTRLIKSKVECSPEINDAIERAETMRDIKNFFPSAIEVILRRTK